MWPLFITAVVGFVFGNGMGQTASPMTQEVESLIRDHPWNQGLMRHLVDDYEIVYPFQIRDRNRVAIDTRNYYFTNATIHFDRCTFVIKSSYNRFKIHLAQNKLLVPPGATFRQIFNDSFRTELRGETIEHCFYQGEVHNEEGSRVALSTCDGLRGVIIIGNQTYFILPLKGGDLGRRHAHVFIRSKLHHKLSCAVNGLTEWSISSGRKQSSGLNRRNRRDVAKETKYIELALIADQTSFVEFDASFSTLARFVLEAVNGMDLVLNDLNTRVALVQFEVWTSRNPIELREDITQTLLNFVKFASTVVYSDRTDMMMLLTSMKFLRQESTLAVTGSVCTARAAGVISNPSRFEEHHLTVMMAHSAAHILGMKHDDESCDCPDKVGCLMSQSISGKRGRFVHGFTSCSRQDYSDSLGTPQARCLFNRPLTASPLTRCGNRIVDEGEQCDCGSVEECDLIDSCCDPVTCTLREGAECGAGPCCRDCKLLPSSHMCRAADDECDVPEFCTTRTAQCPPDARKLNGDSCDGADGICYNGKCSSSTKQCMDLWGIGADRSETACFEKFNILGIESGNCGYDDHRRPKPCAVRNAMCGLLYCKGGADTPAAPSYYKMEFAAMGNTFECKVVTWGMNATYVPGMVKDGTKCGQDRVCLDHVCVDLYVIAVKPNCPTNNLALICSGHGSCTSENMCYCDSGWTGEECGTKLDMTAPALFSAMVTNPSPPPNVPPRRTNSFNNGSISWPNGLSDGQANGQGFAFPSNLDTYTMFIILGGVAGAVFMILLFLVLCYRRRTKTNLRKKHAKEKNADRGSESSIDTAHRSIRFGSLPSYRDEKMQMRQKKRILHQISETDEKDSVSTSKSRDSAHSAAVSAIHDMDDALSKSPERGILKNGSIAEYDRCAPSAARSPLCGEALLHRQDGYESEPAVCTDTVSRMFQNSLRRLNECDLYRTGMSADDEQWADSILDPSSPTSALRPQKTLSCAQSGINFGNCNDQNADTASQREYSDTLSSRCPTAPIYGTTYGDEFRLPFRIGHHQRPSPPESVTSARQASGSVGFVKPQPLKLKNIEYLLRQLDHQQQQTMNCCSNIVSPSSSTTEMSAAEADKTMIKENEDQREEVGSNTESHRDDAAASRHHLGLAGLVTFDAAKMNPVSPLKDGEMLNYHSPVQSIADTGAVGSDGEMETAIAIGNGTRRS